MLVGVTVVLLSSVAGVILGLIGGYSQRYGNLIMRLIDGIMAFPGLILALALVAVLEARLENIIIALAVVYTPRVARVVHSIVLSTKSTEFVSAAVAIGASTPRILTRHLFPSTVGPVVVQASFLFAGAVLAEASLSFLGVGLPPGTPSLGVILSEGRIYLMSAPWMIIFPGVLLFIISMGLNILGDGARDLLDPRYRSGT
jgi:peptide/nickel transport system permease protein